MWCTIKFMRERKVEGTKEFYDRNRLRVSGGPSTLSCRPIQQPLRKKACKKSWASCRFSDHHRTYILVVSFMNSHYKTGTEWKHQNMTGWCIRLKPEKSSWCNSLQLRKRRQWPFTKSMDVKRGLGKYQMRHRSHPPGLGTDQLSTERFWRDPKIQKREPEIEFLEGCSVNFWILKLMFMQNTYTDGFSC